MSRFFDPQTGNYWRYDNGQWWSYSYSAENAIRALELAGWSAERRSHYGDALQHLRAAEKLTNRQRNPKEWARIQNAIANLLLQQGHYPEAENIWRQVIETRVVELGPEDPDTLRSRTALAATMDAQGKSAEAEAENREIVGMDEKLLGADDPDTIASRNNLAEVLRKEGKYSEAEAEYHDVINREEKVLGPDHPDTLRSRLGLAECLLRQDKIQEGKEVAARVVDGARKVCGAEHPLTKAAEKLHDDLQGKK